MSLPPRFCRTRRRRPTRYSDKARDAYRYGVHRSGRTHPHRWRTYPSVKLKRACRAYQTTPFHPGVKRGYESYSRVRGPGTAPHPRIRIMARSTRQALQAATSFLAAKRTSHASDITVDPSDVSITRQYTSS